MSFGFSLKGLVASWTRDFRARYSDIDVDFDRSSRLLPIYGDTGVGKSTLMFLLAGMKRQDGGAVSWRLPDGEPLDLKWRRNKVRRDHFGIMYQDARMLPYLSVADNLCYPLRLRGMNGAAAGDVARSTLKDFLVDGEVLDTILHKFPDELSGGQRRRVAIAKGVIWEPSVFFADEPSSSLDEGARRQVMGLLRDWANKPKTNRAVIWVSHLKEDLAHTRASVRLKMCRGKQDSDGISTIDLTLEPTVPGPIGASGG